MKVSQYHHQFVILGLLFLSLWVNNTSASFGLPIFSVVVKKDAKKVKIEQVHDKKTKIKVIEPEIDKNLEENESADSTLDISEDKEKARYDLLSKTSGFIMNIGNMLLWRYVKGLDSKHESFVKINRIVFCGYLLICQVLYFLTRYLIVQADDRSIVEITSPLAGLPTQLTEGMLGNALNMFQSVATKLVKSTSMTVKDYDMKELGVAFRSLIFEVIIATVAHLRDPRGKMLLYVALTGMTWKLQSPIIQIHVMRFPARGSHARPFKSGLGAMLSPPKSEETEVDETKMPSVVDTQPPVEADSSKPEVPVVINEVKATKVKRKVAVAKKGKKKPVPIEAKNLDFDESAIDDLIKKATTEDKQI